MDYGAVSTLLSFAACQMRSCVNVSIENDIVLENVEPFAVTLERTPELDSRITLNPVDGVVEIIEVCITWYGRSLSVLHKFLPLTVAVVGLDKSFYMS